MPLSKLTLTVEKDLIEDAKRYAARTGSSVSAMVSRFLQSVLQAEEDTVRLGPVTREASGILRLDEDRSYKDLLEQALLEKYGIDE